MNLSYVYSDGKIVVIDEKGNSKKLDYNDKLDDILVSENIIEELNNRKEEILESLNLVVNSKKPSIKKLWFDISLSSILYSILFILVEIIMLWAATGFNDEYISNIIPKNFFSVYSIVFFPTIVLFTFFAKYLKYQENNYKYKTKLGYVFELKKLNKMLKEEKKKLKELQINKTIIQTKENLSVSQVNYLDKLKLLRDTLDFYNTLGYNENEFFEYYQNGELEEKLGDTLTNEEVYMAKDYFRKKEEKRLIKTKKRKN